MALLWIEGFESFGTTNGNAPVGLKQKYDNSVDDASVGTVQAGRIAGQSLRLTTGGTFIQKYNLSAGSTTMIVGFGFYQDALTATNVIFQFWDNTNVQGTLAILTSGLWRYSRGGTLGSEGTALGTSSGSAITTGTWFYVELKVKFHGSTGTVDIWVNGSNVLSLTGQNTDRTGSTNGTSVMFEGSLNANDHTQLDDIYVLDDSGSVNNARLGPQVVKMVIPVSDAGTNAWTPDSGSNHWDRLTDNPRDTTSYLADGTTGHRELFNMGTAHSAAIAGVQVNAVAAITDATVYSLKNSTHTSGGTDTDQAAITIADIAYQTVANVIEKNPETSALWTEAGLNGCQFGFKTG